MLTIRGEEPRTFCDNLSRRGFLQVGTLGLASGMTWADLLCLQARGAGDSKRRQEARGASNLPPYVALDNYADYTTWAGTAHAPFIPTPLPKNAVLDDNHPAVVPVTGLKNLELAGGMTLARLQDRTALLHS